MPISVRDLAAFVAVGLFVSGFAAAATAYSSMDVWDLHDRCRRASDPVACIIIRDDLAALDQFMEANTR